MASSFLPTTPFALYTVPAAYLLALLPRFYTRFAYTTNFNASQPRKMLTDVHSDQTLDSKTRGRIARAEAAHSNGLENLGFYGAGVVAASISGVDVKVVNGLCLGYLGARFVYNFVYVMGDVVPTRVRSLCYLVGVACTWALYIVAGNKVRVEA